MFGTSGIRGPVGEVVTADLALAVGRAVGVDADRVVVGRDPRESGSLLVDALSAGVRELGGDVVDLGVAATPTIARSVAWEDADAGVAVTASHNPPPDNGIKLWQPSGQAYDADRRETVAERVRRDEFDLEAWDGIGARTVPGAGGGDPITGTAAAARHVAALTDSVALEDPLRVVVDLGNGAGGVTVEALQELGCEVETLNAQPDGRFPGRPSEPTPEHCRSLSRLVGESEAEADLGIAHDGDADRMRAVASDGEFLSGDVLLALFAAGAAEPGDRVAVPVDTSLAVADYLAERGVAVTYTPVGDVYVAAAASEPDVAFGGEPSGAWIWPEETLCPDGPLAACRLVELAADRPLGERAAEVPTYPIRRESIDIDRPGEDEDAVVERVRERASGTYDRVETLDGVRVELEDGWFLIRASGTQPIVRVTAQAREAARADDLLADARELVGTARANG